MERRLTFDITDDLIRSSLIHTGFGTRSHRLNWLAFTACGVLILLKIGGLVPALTIDVCLITIAVLLAGNYARAHSRLRNRLRDLARQPLGQSLTLIVRDDGLMFEGSSAESFFPWTRLQRIDGNRDLWLLKMSGKHYPLPASCCDEELAQLFRAKARELGIRMYRHRRDITDETGQIL